MGINFNIVKKPKDKDEEELEEKEEELEELEDDDDDDSKSKSYYDPKKKMIKFMGIIVIAMIVILIILFIVSLGNKNKGNTYSYSEIESILENAAKDYFKDHPDSLPQEEDYVVEIDSANLVADGKMNDLSEYPTKDGVVCTGSVNVQMEDDEYLYSPILNCGDKYSSVLLHNKVVDDSNTVTSGDGLYSRGGEYVFRGENVNNYVELGKSLWRIVKITADDEIVLINQDGAGYTTVWDNRYNEEKQYDAGINNYGVSRIKDYLDQVYKNPDKNLSQDILSKKDKIKLVSYNLCVGKKSPKSEDNKNTDECKQTIKDQKMGLLTLSDYLYASVDPNCKSADTKSCKNYNYLVIKSDWWLMTASSDNTYDVFEVKTNGMVTKDYASNYALARPVVHLNSNVLYKSGKGTLTKPYKVR